VALAGKSVSAAIGPEASGFIFHCKERQTLELRERAATPATSDTDEIMRSLLRQSLDTAELRADGWHDVGGGPGSSEGDFIDWLTIKSQTESVARDVRRIRSHPLVPGSVAIYGYVYDVKSGRLVEVPEAPESDRLGKQAAASEGSAWPIVN